MPVEVRLPFESDPAWFAPRLRARDLAEVRGLIGRGSVEQALVASIELSPICGVALADGEPIFVIGCAAGDNGVGQPWLVGTDLADRHPKAMTKITKAFVAQFLLRWPRLINYVDARNTASIRWLQRLGFSVHEPFVLGVQGEHFHPFTMGY